MKQFKRILMSAACIALCVTLYSCNNAFHEATGATSSGGGGKPTGTGEPAPPPPAGPVTLQSIAVTSQPSRNRFFVGEILDTVTLAGIVVTGYYSDSSEQDLTSQASFSVPPGGAARTETVTVTVSGISTGFTITLYVLPNTIYIGDPSSGGAGYTTLNDAIAAAADGSTITLYEDMQISNDTVLNNKTLTITGYGTTAKKITHAAPGVMFDLGGVGTTLILGDKITLQGPGPLNDNGTNPLVQVSGGATLQMKTGSTITGGNRTGIGGNGGGVLINGGTFLMEGGTITGNTSAESGGGVFVYYGTFTMQDGTISGNSGLSGGGVFIDEYGVFLMEGGTISGNTATSTSGSGGGVRVYGGSLTMSGSAEISGNQSNGVGGGVNVEFGGSLTMDDEARISNNEATNYGGGVYILDNSSLFMNDNARITNNQASQGGGGVYIQYGTFNVVNAPWTTRINGNTATGVGRQVYKVNGSFTDSGGTVGSPTGNDGSDYWD